MYYIQTKARKNSRTYGKTVAQFETLTELMRALSDEDIAGARKPYVFTCIQLPYDRIITQTVTVAGTEITCSPAKAWDAIAS